MMNNNKFFVNVENFNIAACDSVIMVFGDAFNGRTLSKNNIPVLE